MVILHALHEHWHFELVDCNTRRKKELGEIVTLFLVTK